MSQMPLQLAEISGGQTEMALRQEYSGGSIDFVWDGLHLYRPILAGYSGPSLSVEDFLKLNPLGYCGYFARMLGERNFRSELSQIVTSVHEGGEFQPYDPAMGAHRMAQAVQEAAAHLAAIDGTMYYRSPGPLYTLTEGRDRVWEGHWLPVEHDPMPVEPLSFRADQVEEAHALVLESGQAVGVASGFKPEIYVPEALCSELDSAALEAAVWQAQSRMSRRPVTKMTRAAVEAGTAFRLCSAQRHPHIKSDIDLVADEWLHGALRFDFPCNSDFIEAAIQVLETEDRAVLPASTIRKIDLVLDRSRGMLARLGPAAPALEGLVL